LPTVFKVASVNDTRIGKLDTVDPQLDGVIASLMVIGRRYWNNPDGNHSATIRRESIFAEFVPELFENLPWIVWLPAARFSGYTVAALLPPLAAHAEPRELILSFVSILIP
jgi:hypothetical protein